MERDGKPRLNIGNAALLEKYALLLLFSLLLAGVYFVLKPFLLGLVFGIILAVAAWPVRRWLVSRGLSRNVAAGVMLVALLLFVLVPMAVVAPGMATGVRDLAGKGMAWFDTAPKLPDVITGLPYIGAWLGATWDGIVNQTPQAKAMLASLAQPIRQFVTDAALGLASSMLDIGLALIVATGFWAHGENAAAVLRDSLQRLGGMQLSSSADVALSATRGVFYGIVGTAVAQGVLMTVGLLVAGVPAATSLGFVTLLFAISQFGGVLINFVWAGAAWWVYNNGGGTGFAFWFVIAWGIMVTFSDNVLKPIFIGPSLKLPVMLVILGVFGGFVSFGFLGLFIGPTLLAVAFDLLNSWRGRKDAAAEPQ